MGRCKSNEVKKQTMWKFFGLGRSKKKRDDNVQPRKKLSMEAAEGKNFFWK